MFGERWNHILNERAGEVALYHAEGSISFSELDRLARATAWDDKIIVAQGDAPAFMVSLLAGLLRGIPVQVVERDRVPRHVSAPLPAGTALIKQAVGGSGRRRCQFFTAAQILADVDGLHRAFDLGSRGVIIGAISHAHSFGLTVAALQTILNGVPVHWLAHPFPVLLEAALQEHPRAFLPAVPSLWKAWLQSGVPLQKVSLAVAAGSPLSLDLEKRAFKDHGLKIHNLYGASECGAISYDASPGLRTSGDDLGSLLPGVSAAGDAQGFLTVTSASVGLGYDEPFADDDFGAGRFRTMDKVALADERLTFREYAGTGINVAGRKISPTEVREKMRLATGLEGIRIHGLFSRDLERCQEVVAVIDLPQASLTPEFRSSACRHLAAWEVPRKWIGQPASSHVS